MPQAWNQNSKQQVSAGVISKGVIAVVRMMLSRRKARKANGIEGKGYTKFPKGTKAVDQAPSLQTCYSCSTFLHGCFLRMQRIHRSSNFVISSENEGSCQQFIAVGCLHLLFVFGTFCKLIQCNAVFFITVISDNSSNFCLICFVMSCESNVVNLKLIWTVVRSCC